MERTIVLYDTEPGFVRGWVMARAANSLSLVTEGGSRVKLHKRFALRSVGLGVVFVLVWGDASIQGDKTILLEFLALGKDRVEVAATCRQPWARPFFEEILVKMKRRWPEPAIDAKSPAPHKGRRWATGSGTGKPVPSTRKGRVPTRGAHRRRWVGIWALGGLRSMVAKGFNYTKMAEWLGKTHPDLAVSAYTLGEIVRAGQAGFLEENSH